MTNVVKRLFTYSLSIWIFSLVKLLSTLYVFCSVDFGVLYVLNAFSCFGIDFILFVDALSMLNYNVVSVFHSFPLCLEILCCLRIFLYFFLNTLVFYLLYLNVKLAGINATRQKSVVIFS